MTPPMVERVARAMFEASVAMSDAAGFQPGALNWEEIPDNMPQDSRPMWLSFARAAIEAMREPTDDMNDALDRVPGGFGRGAWLTGIDAAINEGRAAE